MASLSMGTLSDRFARGKVMLALGSIPSTIRKKIHVGMPHSRNRTSLDCQGMQLELLQYMASI